MGNVVLALSGGFDSLAVLEDLNSQGIVPFVWHWNNPNEPDSKELLKTLEVEGKIILTENSFMGSAVCASEVINDEVRVYLPYRRAYIVLMTHMFARTVPNVTDIYYGFRNDMPQVEQERLENLRHILFTFGKNKQKPYYIMHMPLADKEIVDVTKGKKSKLKQYIQLANKECEWHGTNYKEGCFKCRDIQLWLNKVGIK